MGQATSTLLPMGLSAIVYLYAMSHKGSCTQFQQALLKVLPIWWLALKTWRAGQKLSPFAGYAKLVALGLLLSSAGDAFLELESRDKNFFVFGLGSFLLAHVAYIVALAKGGRVVDAFAVPFYIYSVGMFGYLLPGLPSELKVHILLN